MSTNGPSLGVHAVEFSRKSLVLLALAALLMALPAPRKLSAQATDTPQIHDSEEYSVYNAVLNAQFASDKSQQFVISGKTIRITKPDYFDRVASDVESDTLSDLKAKNEKSGLLEKRFDLKKPYVFVSDDELDVMFSEKSGSLFIGGWALFYERYPGAPGLITFSRVGFDSKKDEALVYLGFQHHYLGGSSRFLVLSKGDKSWEVRKQVLLLLS
jgi:hypothetical protein